MTDGFEDGGLVAVVLSIPLEDEICRAVRPGSVSLPAGESSSPSTRSQARSLSCSRGFCFTLVEDLDGRLEAEFLVPNLSGSCAPSPASRWKRRSNRSPPSLLDDMRSKNSGPVQARSQGTAYQ